MGAAHSFGDPYIYEHWELVDLHCSQFWDLYTCRSQKGEQCIQSPRRKTMRQGSLSTSHRLIGNFYDEGKLLR